MAHTFPWRSVSQSSAPGQLAGVWLGSWPVQQDLRLLAPPAFTMEGLPAEPLDLLQLLTVTVRPL